MKVSFLRPVITPPPALLGADSGGIGDRWGAGGPDWLDGRAEGCSPHPMSANAP